MSTSKRRERLRSKYDILSFINLQYDKMQNRCSGYGKPKYKGMSLLSRQEFREWAYNQGNLFVLFHQWCRGGYPLKLRPTVDRIDSSLGYNLDNIRWITHSENSRLGATKGR